MNCEQGDLAVVTKAPITTEMKNQFVVIERAAVTGEVVEGYRLAPSVPGPHWLIRSAVNGEKLPLRLHSGELVFLEKRFFADEYMRPIRDKPGEDESFRWAPSPTQKELA